MHCQAFAEGTELVHEYGVALAHPAVDALHQVGAPHAPAAVLLGWNNSGVSLPGIRVAADGPVSRRQGRPQASGGSGTHARFFANTATVIRANPVRRTIARCERRSVSRASAWA